jgi:hypothetical protein
MADEEDYEDYPSGTTFYPDGRIVLPDGTVTHRSKQQSEERSKHLSGPMLVEFEKAFGIKKFVVHVSMGTALTVHAIDEHEAGIIALERVTDCDYANVIGIELANDE